MRENDGPIIAHVIVELEVSDSRIGFHIRDGITKRQARHDYEVLLMKIIYNLKDLEVNTLIILLITESLANDTHSAVKNIANILIL